MPTISSFENINAQRRQALMRIGAVSVTGLILAGFRACALPASEKRRKIITVWINRYDWTAAVDSVTQHADFIETVSPVWFAVQVHGEVSKITEAHIDNSAFMHTVRSRRIQLSPLVTNVSASCTMPELIRPLFSDAHLRARHIALLARMARDGEYDGLDLDYEGFRAFELADLAILVEELSAALHTESRTLAVSIEAQSDNAALPGWHRIAVAADEVRLMAYGTKPRTPGPLTERPWLEALLKKAVSAIPTAKLILGLPVYGLEWTHHGVESGTWSDYMKIARASGYRVERDPVSKSLWYRSKRGTVWLEDGQSVGLKMHLAAEFGVSRFAFWRLGGEDPSIWATVRRFA